MEVSTSLRAARPRSSASTSASERAAGSVNAPVPLIEPGTAASVSSSSEP